MKMNFSKEQLEAIQYEGTNILVSAGAGSGKTAVLTERVVRKLLSGVRIDELIILTFTKAAAAEMRHRIKKRIKEIESLKEQLVYLDNAIISTFDSFCLRIVSSYGYLERIPATVQISDQITIEKTKEEALNSAIVDFYTNLTDSSYETIQYLFDKGDALFKEGITTLVKGIENIPLPKKYLDEYENKFYSEGYYKLLTTEFIKIIREDFNDVFLHFNEFKKALFIANDKVIQYFLTIENLMNSIMSSIDETFIQEILAFSVPRKPLIKDDEEYNELFKLNHDDLKKQTLKLKTKISKLYIENSDDIIQNYQITKPVIQDIVTVVQNYLVKLDILYKKRGIFDYQTVMNYCILLFENHKTLRDEFSYNINEIMVDEYQDTNDFQETLLSLLEHQNLFMVGDLKQSIYRFRNANPSNFLYKFHQYSDSSKGKCIILKENFRSRENVLNDINAFFLPLMDERIGGINYLDDQELIFGNKEYSKHQNSDLNTTVLTYSKKDIKVENPSFNAAFYEATVIAENIVEAINQKMQIYDTDKKSLRPCQFKDFAILMDRKGTFNIYEEVFEWYQIPLQKIGASSFSEQIEILTLHQVLRLMQSVYTKQTDTVVFKQSLYGVLRSFLFSFMDDDIIRFIISIKDTDTNLLEILKRHSIFYIVADKITRLNPLISLLPVDQLLIKIYDEFNFFQMLLRLSEPENRIKRIDYIHALSKSIPKMTFSKFVNYLDIVYESDTLDIEFETLEDMNVNKVKLLTIHKSKGLEFPVCYYPGLSKKFNTQDTKSFFIFDKDFGLVCPLYQEGFFDSAVKTIILSKNLEADLSESIRLFYVALTRAKEKMIFILDTSSIKERSIYYNNDVIIPSTRKSIMAFSDLFGLIDISNKYRLSLLNEMILDKQIEPVQESIELQTKYLNIDAIEMKELQYSISYSALLDENTKKSIEFGIHLHQIFEQFNFQDIATSLTLVESKYHSFIHRFISTFKSFINEKSEIFQEYEFVLSESYSVSKGIIDMFIVNEEEVIVIDYKLKNLDKFSYINQVKGYLSYLKSFYPSKRIHGMLYSLISGEVSEVNL